MQNKKKITRERKDSNKSTEFKSPELYPLTDELIDKIKKKRKLSESETGLFRDELFDAVKNYKPSKLLFLLQFKAELPIDIKERVTGWTALMYAVFKRYTEIFEILIENGADVNIQNEDGWTALIMAALVEHTGIVKCLLSIDANPLLKTKDGKTAYDWANDEEIKQILKKYTKMWELIGGENILLIKSSVRNCEPEKIKGVFLNL